MSGLGDKIKVERLDTGRLARIEERVLAARELPGEGMRERRAWLRFAPLAAAACALVLVAGALGYWLRGGSSGSGSLAGTAPVPAVTTGPGESATVAVGDAIVTIDSSSQVSIRTRPDGRIDLDLERGMVDCDVTPRPGRPIFAVHAADVDVAVVGTAFSVARTGDQVTVKVSRGKVSVTRAGKQVYVAAGENWPTGTQVASADPDRDPDPHPGSGSVSDPDPDPGSDSDSDSDSDSVSDPDPHPDPGAEHRSSKHVDKGPKPRVALPPGLPALAACASAADPIQECATQGVTPGEKNAPALYSAIRLEVAAGYFKQAMLHASLYEKRFQGRRPKEAEAVRQLRQVAEGGE